MIAELQAAVSGIRIAMEIGKGLAAVDNAMEQAALKMKIADLMGSLADAKTALTDVQDAIEKRDAEIRFLEEAIKNKANVARMNNGYYELNGEGKPEGDPYCSRCYEVDHRLIHLALPLRYDDGVKCPQCKEVYDGNLTHRIRPPNK